MDVEDLHQLAGLLRARNALDLQVAQLINRPALPGRPLPVADSEGPIWPVGVAA